MSGRIWSSIGVGALWSGALLAAAAGHAGIAAMALNWAPTDSAPPAAPPVLMISLAPPAAPEVPEQQVAPGAPSANSAPQPEEKPPEKVVEKPKEQPKPEAEKPTEVVEQPEPDIPELPEKEQAVAVLAPPLPEPRPETKPPVRETPEKVKKEKRKKNEPKVASRAAAPATFNARRAPTASAPAAGAARVPAAAMASWKGDLMAQLNRHKRYPSGTSSSGTALVAFRINRTGEVTSARLVRSSGDRALDQEAVALPQRASPLPKPPEALTSRSIALTVPIRFGRR